jgi:lipopolysaccharide transport system permease protein
MKNRAFLHQTLALTKASLKARYRKTFAGFVWVVLNPVIIYGVQALVFKKILRLQVDHYPLFLLSGLIPWIFISQSIEMTISIFVTSSQLIKSYQVHPLVFLSAQILDNFINFIVAFLCILLAVSFFEPLPLVRVLLLPLPFLVLVTGVFGAAWLFSTLHVFFRDLRYIMSFILHIGFFLTPIFYPISFVPENLKRYFFLNPFYQLIEPFHALLIGFEPILFARRLSISFAVSTSFVFFAFLVWKKSRNSLYFRI